LSRDVEGVCEDKSRFVGRLSDAEHGAVTVPLRTLAKYVGVYSGAVDHATANRSDRSRGKSGGVHGGTARVRRLAVHAAAAEVIANTPTAGVDVN
jgi:hypothetical protein